MTANNDMAAPESVAVTEGVSSTPELWQMLGSRVQPTNITPHVRITDVEHKQLQNSVNLVSVRALQQLTKGLHEDICGTALEDDSQSSSAYHSTYASTPGSMSPNLEAVQTEDGIPDLQPQFEAIERASFAQERIWFLHEYLTDPTTFNVTMAYAVQGPLQPVELATAFRAMSNRHESLRTAFFLDSRDGDPQLFQGVLPETQIEISIHTIGATQSVDEVYTSVRDHVYDLARGKTMRVAILTLTPTTHFLILGFHHIALDGFSAQIFIKDLQMIYSTGQILPPAPRYRDYTLLQRQSLANDTYRESLDFWKTKLANLPPPIPLFAFARVSTRKPLNSYRVHSVERTIGISLASKIKETAHKIGGTTPFFLYLTTLRELVFRLLGHAQKDICLGISDAGRADKEALQVVGMFVNMLPLQFRAARPGQSFRDLLSTTTRQVRTALTHAAVPYQVLLDELTVQRSPSENPLFQILLNYKMGSTEEATLGSCRAQSLRMDDARTGLDLVVEVEEFGDGNCKVAVRGQEYLYDKEGLGFILSSLVSILEEVTARPSMPVANLAMFDEKSITHALELSRGERAYTDEHLLTVVHLFDRHCKAHPRDVAVKQADGQFLSYGELQGRAQKLARQLQELKGSAAIVVACKPSLDTIVSIVGIHYAGCTYVPVDIEHPEERLRTIVEDCKPRAILYHEDTKDLATSLADGTIAVPTPQSGMDEAFPIRASVNDTAYILYTSGSTGKPKGVIVSHGNLTCQILSMRQNASLERETVLHQSGVAFDASIDCVYAALAGQGTLVMAPPEVRRDPVQLASLMVREQITYTQMTSSEYHNLAVYGAEHLKQCVTYRNAFCGGEKFLSSLIPLFRGLKLPALRVWNRYGPTEITVSSSMQMIVGVDGPNTSTELIPCGRPLPNYSVFILDEQRRPVPAGVPGEICIGGGGVAQGYLNNARLTASKFVKNIYASEEDVQRGWDRLYRTGDRGYLLSDGSLAFLGRMEGSAQVKIRGQRVELDEIETAIVATSEGTVLSAGVCVKGDNANAVLAAYVVVHPDVQVDSLSSLVASLARSLPLPRYMRPSSFMAVGKLPHTTSGKLDRQALCNLSGTPIAIETNSRPAPLGVEEEVMAKAWREVLPGEAFLSADSNFFDVGGNSLLLVRLQKVIEELTGKSVALTELFSTPGLSVMARLLQPQEATKETTEVDWESETQLTPSLLGAIQTSPRGSPDSKVEVILTGATGFLGRTLLHQLLTHPRIAHVHCLAIRNSSVSQQSLTCNANLAAKLTLYLGDLSHPTLSLDDGAIASLSNRIGLIIHNGASVSFLKSYSTLRGPNFHSTRFLLQLSIERGIPFHFVSTGGVVNLTGQPTWPPVSVRNHPPPGEQGYIASKWASERLIENAAEALHLRGVHFPVVVHRPASIVARQPGTPGTSENEPPAMDIMHNMVQYARTMRCFPVTEGVNWRFDFVGVDAVASRILASALGDEVEDERDGVKYVHHCNARKLSPRELKAELEEEAGCVFEEVEVGEWVRRAKECGMDGLVAATLVDLMERQRGVVFTEMGL
ncbi:acetyl-CoA synthetase-like protein [Aspergillus indologenus CBS 114.80]|uniref:Acetyl-CoA synthetase-like protein n=1 Tax=Aspergillus indologenus CBS 114.80 TaxID=1450541 RepID=A0A2V5IHH8_9EURO|nr:acetyl-CoA synthetase-like protein [Aspergillus indologenus CBS 114.80]